MNMPFNALQAILSGARSIQCDRLFKRVGLRRTPILMNEIVNCVQLESNGGYGGFERMGIEFVENENAI